MLGTTKVNWNQVVSDAVKETKETQQPVWVAFNGRYIKITDYETWNDKLDILHALVVDEGKYHLAKVVEEKDGLRFKTIDVSPTLKYYADRHTWGSTVTGDWSQVKAVVLEIKEVRGEWDDILQDAITESHKSRNPILVKMGRLEFQILDYDSFKADFQNHERFNDFSVIVSYGNRYEIVARMFYEEYIKNKSIVAVVLDGR